jgi:hypothetical protein
LGFQVSGDLPIFDAHRGRADRLVEQVLEARVLARKVESIWSS